MKTLLKPHCDLEAPRSQFVDCHIPADNQFTHQASPSSASEGRQLPLRPPQEPQHLLETPLVGLLGNEDDLRTFDAHLAEPDNLLLPPVRNMMGSQEMPIIRMDGSTGNLLSLFSSMHPLEGS